MSITRRVRRLFVEGPDCYMPEMVESSFEYEFTRKQLEDMIIQYLVDNNVNTEGHSKISHIHDHTRYNPIIGESSSDVTMLSVTFKGRTSK